MLAVDVPKQTAAGFEGLVTRVALHRAVDLIRKQMEMSYTKGKILKRNVLALQLLLNETRKLV